MIVCPYCHREDQQVKAGKNAGSQRYKCQQCRRRYTPEPISRGYPSAVRQRAEFLHSQGMKISQIGKELAVHPRSVINWLREVPPEKTSDLSEASAVSAVPPDMPPPGKRRRTIQDVAEKAGVSTSTISNFLNQKGRMSDPTKARVQEAIAALHFTPSALMRALRQRRTGILGVYMFGLGTLDQNVGGSLAPPLLAGISEAADAAERNLLLYTGWGHPAAQHDRQKFLDGHIDGLIWIAPDMETPMLDQLTAAGLPVIAVLTRHVPADIGYVNLDNVSAVRDLVIHLHGLGHHRIAYIGPVEQSNFIDRFTGYKQGLNAVGLPVQPALEETRTDVGWPFKRYNRVLDRWLALPEPPTAIIVANDGGAEHMLGLIQERGLRVPVDIAVTGFDDIPDAVRFGPGLTTIRQPFHEMGRLAVTRVLALAAGSPVEECRVTVPGQMIVRASTSSSHQ